MARHWKSLLALMADVTLYEAAGVGHDFADRYLRAIEAVSADDVLRVAKTYLTSPTVVRLEALPR